MAVEYKPLVQPHVKVTPPGLPGLLRGLTGAYITFIEVKKGKSTPFEFSWFSKQFPKRQLLVVNSNRFKTDNMRGLTVEEFLELDDELLS